MSTLKQEEITIDYNLVVPTDRRFLNRQSATPSQLQAAGINPVYRQWIRVLDTYFNTPSSEPLYLLHYLTTVPESDSPEDIQEHSAIMRDIGKARGVILDSQNNVVCRSFGYTPDVVIGESVTAQNVGEMGIHSDTVAYPLLEGTIIRLFYHERWMISTHRKIDAEPSYWTGPTFGSMFAETFPEMQQLLIGNGGELDTTSCYILLLQHPQNRLVYPVPKPVLHLVGEYNRTTQELSVTPKKPVEFTFETLPVLLKDFHQEYSPEKAGIILFNEKDPLHPVKVISSEYHFLRNVRGNEACIRTRYMHLRGTGEQEVLKKWYPEHMLTFLQVESDLHELAEKIHGFYMEKFVLRNEPEKRYPKEEHVVMSRCHQWHKQNRVTNVVRLPQVVEILEDTPNNYVITMLRRLRKEKKQIAKLVESM